MKKIILLMYSIVLIVSFAGCGDTSPDDFETSGYGDGVEVTDYLGDKDTIVIPSEIDGKKVLSVGRGFCPNSNLKKVVIPNTVESIQQSAFEGCKSLKEVTLSDQLEWIDYYVFQNCSALKEIEIPETVTRIDMGSFLGCSNLHMVVHKNSRGESYAKSYSEMYGFTYTVK